MATIETIYRARIDYEHVETIGWFDDDPIEKVEDFAFRVCRGDVVECEAFCGNACCMPYITLESEDRKALELAAGKIERYIRRFSRRLKLIE